jgi:hypothetical protein
MPVQVGTEFRQYRVLEQVGEGGMGVVYRARDTKLGREVALKFLTRLWSGVAGERDRLRHEARSLAALNHPNIVTVHDIDEADGVRTSSSPTTDARSSSISASRSSATRGAISRRPRERSARWRTCRPNRRAAARWARTRMSSRSASSRTSCWPARGRSWVRGPARCSRRSCGIPMCRWPSDARTFPSDWRQWSIRACRSALSTLPHRPRAG